MPPSPKPHLVRGLRFSKSSSPLCRRPCLRLQSVAGHIGHPLTTPTRSVRPSAVPLTLYPITTQTRQFLPGLDSLLPAAPKPRTLTATRTLPFAPEPLFHTIASVDSYAAFLPFLSASTVTARDPATSHPTRAFLTVGYGAFQETFTSHVICDRERWSVEARSGKDAGSPDGAKKDVGADEGIFEYLNTKWVLDPVQTGEGADAPAQDTRVWLQVQFKFKSPIHAALMSAVEDKVAGMMIEAFEKRVREGLRRT